MGIQPKLDRMCIQVFNSDYLFLAATSELAITLPLVGESMKYGPAKLCISDGVEWASLVTILKYIKWDSVRLTTSCCSSEKQNAFCKSPIPRVV